MRWAAVIQPSGARRSATQIARAQRDAWSGQADDHRILQRRDPADEHLGVLVLLQRLLEGLQALGVGQDDLVRSPHGYPAAAVSLDIFGSHGSDLTVPVRCRWVGASDRNGLVEHLVTEPRLDEEMEMMSPEERAQLLKERTITDLSQVDPAFLERARADARRALEQRQALDKQQ